MYFKIKILARDRSSAAFVFTDTPKCQCRFRLWFNSIGIQLATETCCDAHKKEVARRLGKNWIRNGHLSFPLCDLESFNRLNSLSPEIFKWSDASLLTLIEHAINIDADVVDRQVSFKDSENDALVKHLEAM